MPPKRSASDEGEDEPIGWGFHVISTLRAELEKRGLPKGGRKQELVARLEAWDTAALVGESHFRPEGEAPTAMPIPRPAKRAKKARSPSPIFEGPTASQIMSKRTIDHETGEQRPRPFVGEPDEKFKKNVKKVRKERMFMLDRNKSVDGDRYVCETFDLSGSTGNIYQVTIGRTPKCTCMDARIRGQKCKHIDYALIIVLKAPTHLQYQLGFLSSELETIFANAPVTRAPPLHAHAEAAEPVYNGKRKPVDGECPICVFDMEPGERLVWCRASCGQNFHEACFETWRASKNGRPVTCVYCRAPWQEEHDVPSVGARGDARPVSDLAALKYTAPKIGSYRNIGHLPMYQADYKGGADDRDGIS